MRRIDGGKDSALTWGDLYETRSNLHDPACESRLNIFYGIFHKLPYAERYGGVRGRELITPSYSIAAKQLR